jgi:hypothetical protein
MRFFISLSLCFIFFTITGTLIHECGHYLMARYLGFNAVIDRNMTYVENNPIDPTPGESFLITFGGSFLTILIGTVGITWLIIKRKSYQDKRSLTFFQWLAIFLSLFWLRQTLNFLFSIAKLISTGLAPERGDEIKMAKYLNLPVNSISCITGIIGLTLLCAVVFNFIPKQQRLTFLLSGLFGGIIGYTLWVL